MPNDHERLSGFEDRHRDGGPEPAVTQRRDSPRRRGLGHAWIWLVFGVLGLGAGIVLGHGLLIAAGLVVAGIGGQLFDPDRRRVRTRTRTRTRNRARTRLRNRVPPPPAR